MIKKKKPRMWFRNNLWYCGMNGVTGIGKQMDHAWTAYQRKVYLVRLSYTEGK